MARRASSTNLVKLTRANIATFTLDPGQSERVVWDSETPGLGLRIRRSGSAAWMIRPPRNGGRSVVFTLGSAAVLSLADARAAARERMAKATLGDDPHAMRREARAQAAVTMGAVVGRYVASAEKRLRPSTIYNLKNHLNAHWKPLHGMAMRGVRRADVAVQIGIIAETNGPHAANRARVVLSTFFGWAMGEGIVEANPVIGTNRVGAAVARDRVLSDAELIAVWRACGDDDFGRILKLLLLTGQRRDEVAGMAWDELDLAGGLWTLPAPRSKNRRPHDIPLSATALDILARVPRLAGRDLVFGAGVGPFSGFTKAKERLDERAGITVPWRLHDLRRTAATGMAGIGVLPHVVEAVLNHVSGSRAGVAGIYNRASYASEKRAALDAWDAHVLKLVGA